VIFTGSPVYHIGIGEAPAITSYAGEWAHVKLAFREETHTLERLPLVAIISVLKVGEAVGLRFVKGTNS
jgi:hypothetical protein